MLSRPLLLLSIATAFSDHSEFDNDASDSAQVSPETNDSHADSDSQLEVSSEQSIPNERYKVDIFLRSVMNNYQFCQNLYVQQLYFYLKQDNILINKCLKL